MVPSGQGESVRRLWGAKGGIQAAVFPDPTASNIATPASWPRAGIMRQGGGPHSSDQERALLRWSLLGLFSS